MDVNEELKLLWKCVVIVEMCRSLSTISNMNISATSGPITMKFYQKHHLDGVKGCIRFWARLDQNSGFHGNR